MQPLLSKGAGLVQLAAAAQPTTTATVSNQPAPTVLAVQDDSCAVSAYPDMQLHPAG